MIVCIENTGITSGNVSLQTSNSHVFDFIQKYEIKNIIGSLEIYMKYFQM